MNGDGLGGLLEEDAVVADADAEMPTRYEFNKKRKHSYGIGWKLANPKNWIERFYYADSEVQR